MPPARTIIRGQTFSSGFTSSTDHNKELKKPYRLPTFKRNAQMKNNSVKAIPSLQRQDEHRPFMDLDEFLKKAEEDEPSTNHQESESDPDFPKPTIDLLASLVTLGKMIKNQKQLIEKQSSQNLSSESSESSSSASGSSDDKRLTITTVHKNNTSRKTYSTAYLSSAGEDFEFKDKKLPSPAKSRTYSNEEDFEFKEQEINSPSSSYMSKRFNIPDGMKDIDYWDRRKRNNLAAKKSREERRKKELEIVETAKQLENENSQLTLMLNRLTSRNEWLESRLQDLRCKAKNSDPSLESLCLSSADES